jgi:L-arabinose isomerase
VDFTVISGHPESRRFTGRLSAYLEGARAAGLLKGQTIGITGKPFVGMGDFAVDFGFLKERLAIRTVPIDKESIVRASREVSASAIEEQRQHDLEECDASDLSQETHRDDIRSYIAIRELLDRNGATGYAMNFQHVLDGMAVPFYACSRLQELGYGYGGEGDVLTAALGGPLNAIAVSKFDEFFCPDWSGGRILMSHMGETDPRFAKGHVRLATRNGFLNQMDSTIFKFKADPGAVTFTGITQGGAGDFRIVAGILDIVDYPVLEQVAGPHYVVKPRCELTDFLERYAECGGGHHVYISRGDKIEAVKTMAKILDFEFCHVK